MVNVDDEHVQFIASDPQWLLRADTIEMLREVLSVQRIEFFPLIQPAPQWSD